MKESLKEQIYVTESLTSLRITKLKDARNEYGFNEVWTSDGRIMVMKEGSAKPKVTCVTLEAMIVLRFTLWVFCKFILGLLYWDIIGYSKVRILPCCLFTS